MKQIMQGIGSLNASARAVRSFEVASIVDFFKNDSYEMKIWIRLLKKEVNQVGVAKLSVHCTFSECHWNIGSANCKAMQSIAKCICKGSLIIRRSTFSLFFHNNGSYELIIWIWLKTIEAIQVGVAKLSVVNCIVLSANVIGMYVALKLCLLHLIDWLVSVKLNSLIILVVKLSACFSSTYSYYKYFK